MKHCSICGMTGHDRRHHPLMECAIIINTPTDGGPCLGVMGSKSPSYFEMLIKEPNDGRPGRRSVAGFLIDNMNPKRRPLFELLASENKLSKKEAERWQALIVLTDWAIEEGWVDG